MFVNVVCMCIICSVCVVYGYKSNRGGSGNLKVVRPYSDDLT